MTLKPVRSEDTLSLETLLSLMAAYYAHDHILFDLEKAQVAVLRMLKGAHGRAWLALEAERPVGYAVLVWSYSLEYGGRASELDELYLIPEARGRGVGRTVMLELLQTCRDEGVVLLRLETEPENESARAFYASLGFSDVPRRFMQLRL